MGYLVEKRLKIKIIKRYLIRLQSFRLKCILDMAKLKVYSQLILPKIFKNFQKIYWKGDTQDKWPITYNILLKLISRFDETNLEKANLYMAFCVAFTGFL